MKETQESRTLEYQKPPVRRRDSAWSLVGFALALVTASVAGIMAWDLWRSSGSGARVISFGVSPAYYVTVAAVAGACVRGLTLGRKRFAIAGLALAPVVTVVVIVRGLPW